MDEVYNKILKCFTLLLGNYFNYCILLRNFSLSEKTVKQSEENNQEGVVQETF